MAASPDAAAEATAVDVAAPQAHARWRSALREPLRTRMLHAIAWAVPVGAVFFAIYPFTNHWASQRAHTWALHADWELRLLPFWPQWIWVYLSMYLLFLLPPFWLGVAALRRLAMELMAATVLAGAVFMLLPAHLGHVREVPVAPPWTAALFEAMFRI